MSSLVQAQRFLPSNVTLQMPAYGAENLVISGLTAAQMRLALPLVCLARGKKANTVIVEKPRLEEMSGVVLDSTHRLMAPLQDAKIDAPGDELHGTYVFEDLQYDPGVRGKSVGRILAELSIGMGHFLARGRNRTVALPCDELRQYRSVPAIIMRMKLGAEMELAATASSVMTVFTPEIVREFFGSYGDVSVIKRPSAATGEIVEHVAMSRAGNVLINPAVEEIARVSQMMRPVAEVAMEGKKWKSITVRAARLTVRVSAPKPRPTVKIRPLPTRKVLVKA